MANPFQSRIRKAVRRSRADTYLLLTLISFGFSVGMTRLFLELSGYPQLGAGDLHIAHMLWGGVLLFAAALLPLIYSNRWALTLNAVLAGVGVGLFIDEVGKFITQTNDYFYPAAAPIVYAFFLLTVMVYLQVRKPGVRDARSELYAAFDTLGEVLDRDLEPQERAALMERLVKVQIEAEEPHLRALAEQLLTFLRSDDLQVVPEHAGWLGRLEGWSRAFERRVMTLARLKAVIVAGLGGVGTAALLDLIAPLRALGSPEQLQAIVADWVALGRVSSATGLSWFIARLSLEGVAGAMLILGAVLLAIKRERTGFLIANAALLFSLLGVNLLVFYFEQFSTILLAIGQFALLLGLHRYRVRLGRSQTD